MPVIYDLCTVLANVSANAGLYTAFFSAILQLLFGKFPFNSFGPAAVAALIVGNAVLGCVYTLKDLGFEVTGSEGRIFEEFPLILPINSFLTFAVGIGLLLFQIFRISRVLNILMPKVLVSSFTSAASIAIVTSQFKGLLGVKIPLATGMFTVPKTYYDVVLNLGSTNWIAVGVSSASFVLIFGLQYLEPTILKSTSGCYQFLKGTTTDEFADPAVNIVDKKPRGSLPVILITVIIISMATYIARLDELFDLKVVGKLQSGLPAMILPWEIFGIVPTSLHGSVVFSLLPSVISIILTLFASLQSVLQSFPYQIESPEEQLDEVPIMRASESGSNSSHSRAEMNSGADIAAAENTSEAWNEQSNEILTLSFASLVGSFFNCFAPSPSLSRSAILATLTKATSNVAAGVCAIFLGISSVFLTGLIYYIPMACLSAIVITSLIGTLKRTNLGYYLLREAFEQKDFESIQGAIIWVMTFVGGVVIDPTVGVMMGIGSVIISKALIFSIRKWKPRTLRSSSESNL